MLFFGMEWIDRRNEEARDQSTMANDDKAADRLKISSGAAGSSFAKGKKKTKMLPKSSFGAGRGFSLIVAVDKQVVSHSRRVVC